GGVELRRRQGGEARLRRAHGTRRGGKGRRLAVPHGAEELSLSKDVSASLPVGFADVRAAADRLRGVAHHTPAVRSRTLDARCGAEVVLKCENLQRMGAFKFRGAYNLMSQLPADRRKRGVVAYSSGNHAQGVALAARLLGITATIVMPSDAPAVKLEATREYGAEIVLYERERSHREEIAAGI